MSHKKKIFLSIGAPIIGFIITAVLYRLGSQFDDIGVFLLLFSIPSLIFLIIQYFLSEQVFIAWWKFIRIYIPLAAILIAVIPNESGLMDIGFFGYDKEDLTWWASIFFVLISLILIIRTHRRLKRQAKVMPTSFPTGGQKSI